jgi:hypothetical protein
MFLGSKAAAGAYGWQPYRHLWADCLDNVGSLTSYNPVGLHGSTEQEPWMLKKNTMKNSSKNKKKENNG